MGHYGMATFDRRKAAPKHLLMDICPARSAPALASERPLGDERWRRQRQGRAGGDNVHNSGD